MYEKIYIKRKINLRGVPATEVAKALYPDKPIEHARPALYRKLKGEIGWHPNEIEKLQLVLLKEAEKLKEDWKELVKQAQELKQKTLAA